MRVVERKNFQSKDGGKKTGPSLWREGASKYWRKSLNALAYESFMKELLLDGLHAWYILEESEGEQRQTVLASRTTES